MLEHWTIAPLNACDMFFYQTLSNAMELFLVNYYDEILYVNIIESIRQTPKQQHYNPI